MPFRNRSSSAGSCSIRAVRLGLGVIDAAMSNDSKAQAAAAISANRTKARPLIIGSGSHVGRRTIIQGPATIIDSKIVDSSVAKGRTASTIFGKSVVSGSELTGTLVEESVVNNSILEHFAVSESEIHDSQLFMGSAHKAKLKNVSGSSGPGRITGEHSDSEVSVSNAGTIPQVIYKNK